MARRMRRETCIWEIPRQRPIPAWVRSFSKRRRRTTRSRSESVLSSPSTNAASSLVEAVLRGGKKADRACRRR